MESLTEWGELRRAKFKTIMPRDLLELRIVKLLKSCNVCILATCSDNIPRATPIEYYSKDTTIYFLAAATTKLKNLELNPRISIGVFEPSYTDWTEWYDVKGAQITGRPEIIRYEQNPEAYEAALEIYDWRPYRKAIGKPDKKPMKTTVVKVSADRIEYRDLGLMREGYGSKQIWEPGH
jgi:nitroimidazol reductase NimA-like FMN-containing flavoprotein (pyridoxamine 5'-phosphate oxidase superfamily)